jgi:hypothetical protein
MATHRFVFEFHWGRKAALTLCLAFIVPLLAITGLLTALAAHPGAAAAGPALSSPTTLAYQGQIKVNGQPFSGVGLFKFAIVSLNGGTVYWANDGSASQPPASAVQIAVTSGLFNVLLGDPSLPHMTQAISSGVFLQPGRALRVWFNDGANGFQQLAPDVILAAVPYALNAETLDGLDSSAFQARVSGSCAVGSSVRTIAADGTVTCNAQTTFYSPLLQAQSVDLTAVDAGLTGFSGGFTDGRYGYFVPGSNGAGAYPSKVARVDLQNFANGGVTVLDVHTADAGLAGFVGGFTDGRYGYFVPNNNGTGPDGKVARVDLQNFTTGGVTALDLASVDPGLKGFAGGFTDGRYGYFVPNYSGGITESGKVARVDLQNFTTGGVTVLDLASVDAGLKGFTGGFTDGRYGYFVPVINGPNTYDGKVARVDLHNFTTGGVTALDLAAVDASLIGFTGGFTDGRYGFFVPHGNGGESGKVARVDLHNFTTSGVTVLDLTTVDAGLKGFAGGFTDGRYGYFVPDYYCCVFHGKVARVDLRDFTASGVTALDLAAVDPALVGFYGGFTDGRYGYFVPWNNYTSGKVARIQLFSGSGAP